MRVIIADDHPFSLEGTKSYVEKLGYFIQDTCNNGINAYNLIETKKPDIAILDINMPGMDGIEVLEKVFFNKLKTKVVLLTMHKEISLFNKAIDLNVYGYILKEYAHEELKICLNEIKKGNKYDGKKLIQNLIVNEDENQIILSSLNASEQKIIKLIANQHTTKQIASMLFLSEKTIEAYRSNIIEKLKLPKEKNILLKWTMKNLK